MWLAHTLNLVSDRLDQGIKFLNGNKLGQRGEDIKTNSIPEHRAPLPLAEFLAQWKSVERTPDGSGLYLYHGTNCYRRWEINKSGAILPGRSGYSFFCDTAAEAYKYARAAGLRDIGPRAANSLTSEPVVLKVRFNERTWVQADFVQEISFTRDAATQPPLLSVAVLGPISISHISQVLHCFHGCHGQKKSIRSFADGTLQSGIRRLKDKTGHWRFDAWLLQKLGSWTQEFTTWITGRQPTEVSTSDELRRLQTSLRA